MQNYYLKQYHSRMTQRTPQTLCTNQQEIIWSIITFSHFTPIRWLLYFVGIFLTDVYATGTGTVLDPFQQYVKRGHESVLQCSIENARLIWYKNGIEGWSVIANQYVTINDTQYKTSANPNTGLYYRLHVVNTQPVDEGIYRCIGGITDEYFLQLTLYGEQNEWFMSLGYLLGKYH